ncbi:MAG: membrane protease YdiL (CAAX protease family), partial [Glaciecola sp.]
MSTPLPPPPKPRRVTPRPGAPRTESGEVSPDVAWPTPRTDGITAEAAFRVPFSIGIGIGLVAWTFVAQLLVGIVAVALGIDLDDGGALRVIVVIAQIVTVAGTIFILRQSGRLSWRLWGPTRPSLRDLGVGLGAGLAGYAIVLAWIFLFTSIFGQPDPVEQALLRDVGTSVTVIVTSFLAAVLMAPIVEEIVFRGVLFQALRRRLGLIGAMAVSAGIFTGVHVELYPPGGAFQPVAVVALFLLGAWLAYSFHRSGSLTVPILAHA